MLFYTGESGEIDIVEYFTNSPNKIYNYIHSSTNDIENGTLLSAKYHLESAEEEFHAYGILWTDNISNFILAIQIISSIPFTNLLRLLKKTGLSINLFIY